MYILTCGHTTDYIGETIPTKAFARDGSRAVGYPTLCNSCLDTYRKNNLELKTEEEQDAWLSGKIKY